MGSRIPEKPSCQPTPRSFARLKLLGKNPRTDYGRERIIGGRRVATEEKILSLYDDQINVIKRGKAGAQVEFGNKLWLGETSEGLIVDHQFYQDNPSDTALIKPAIERLVDAQQLVIGNVWEIAAWPANPTPCCWKNAALATGSARATLANWPTNSPTNQAFAKDSNAGPPSKDVSASSRTSFSDVVC